MAINNKQLLVTIILFLGIFTISSKNPLHVDKYIINSSESKVEWTGEKLTGKHTGTINISNGILEHNHGKFTGKFIIDMSSIDCTDLSGKSKTKLENHLKSDDFFGVDSFPTAKFEITTLTPMAGATEAKHNFMVDGKLTIRGITNNLQFPALIKFEGASMTATGEVKVDRSKYNVKHRSKSFFEDIGDKIIYDEFTLKLNLKAAK